MHQCLPARPASATQGGLHRTLTVHPLISSLRWKRSRWRSQARLFLRFIPASGPGRAITEMVGREGANAPRLWPGQPQIRNHRSTRNAKVVSVADSMAAMSTTTSTSRMVLPTGIGDIHMLDCKLMARRRAPCAGAPGRPYTRKTPPIAMIAAKLIKLRSAKQAKGSATAREKSRLIGFTLASA